MGKNIRNSIKINIARQIVSKAMVTTQKCYIWLFIFRESNSQRINTLQLFPHLEAKK